MYEIRAYKFRIHPDDKREVKIDKGLILAQQLYNKILERIKSRYKTDSILNSYLKDAIKDNKNFTNLYSQTRQNIFITVVPKEDT